MRSSLTKEHLDELREARSLLESPGFSARLAQSLAEPLERGITYLPPVASDTVLALSEKALGKALDAALWTVARERSTAQTGPHRVAAALSGTLGGAFGLAGLSVELPLSTTLMLRSIACIARSEGEDLETNEARLACLQVFALGGDGHRDDDAADAGYFTLRMALASSVSDALRHLAARRVLDRSAPTLLRLLSAIAARYGIVVSEKAIAQAVPVIGAAGGATINTLFMDHFQQMARGHFIVRRLERHYGERTVRAAWLH